MAISEKQEKISDESTNSSITGPNVDLKVFTSMEQLIANKNNPTPLLLLDSAINQNPNFRIYVKLEYLNPFGSIKDRVALYMLKNGVFKKGQTLLDYIFTMVRKQNVIYYYD